jgi:hypothetical protein
MPKKKVWIPILVVLAAAVGIFILRYQILFRMGGLPEEQILFRMKSVDLSCKTVDDCTVSCRFGAINAKWFEKNIGVGNDCLDGCGWVSKDLACVDGLCAMPNNPKCDLRKR